MVYNAADDVLVDGTYGAGVYEVQNASTVAFTSGVLNITGDQDYPNENDIFRLVRDPNNNALLDVYINGTLNGPYQLGAISQISVNGEGGNNTLIVDSSNGLINVPNGIQYNGGNTGTGGFNTLQLDQPTAATVQTSDTYSVGPNAGQGTDVIVGAGGTQTVYFENLAPVYDSVPATTATVNATNAANAVNYAEGTDPTPALDPTWGEVTVDNQEVYEFTVKAALVINGLAGSDQFNLNNPNTPAALASITVNGGDPTASDTLIANGTTGADTIDFTPTAADGGTITGAGPVNITFATVEHVTINGQGGNDSLTVTTPTGSNQDTYTAGPTVDSGTVQVASLVPLSFTNLGAGGNVALANAGAVQTDTLVYNGAAGNDLFTVSAAAVNLSINQQFQVTGPGVENLVLNGFPGAIDALIVNASAANQFVVVNHGNTPNSGDVQIYTAAVLSRDISFTNIPIISPNVAGEGNILVMGPDANEPNDFQSIATFLGSGATLQIQHASIFPNNAQFPGIPGDQDYYQVVAQSTGTLDFQVYFNLYTGLLPAAGELDLQVLDAAGDVIAAAPGTFGAQGATANARVRIPAVAGQSYYLHVFGATPAVVNGYSATIIDTPPPVPYNLELARSVLTATVTSGGSGYTSEPTITFSGGGGTGAIGTAQISNGVITSITITDGTGYTSPPTITITGGGGSGATATAAITDTGDLPPSTPNDDSGPSQFDNITNINTPTIYIHVADGVLLNDLPGNGTANTPPAGVIPIPYSTSETTPGFRVAVFDGANTQAPVGYATPVGASFPGLYQYTFTTALADGVHNLVAEVQMVDPATPTETGFGAQSTALQITVDTLPPPVSFGTPGVAKSGLAAGSDSGVQGYPLTNVDNVTNDTAPTFYGVAEANAIVSVYAEVETTTFHIATATEAGTTVTITTTPPHGLSVGSVVTISGVGVAGYNGTFTVTSVPSATTFTYTDTNSGLAASSGGTATPSVLLGTSVAVPNDGTNADANGAWTVASSVDLNNPAYFPHDGTRTLLVTAEDLAGNVSEPSTLSIFVDTQGPQISNVQVTGSPTYNLFGEKTVAGTVQGPTPLVNSLTIGVVDNPARDAADFPNYLALLIPTPVVTITAGGSGYTSPPTVVFSGGGAVTQATGIALLSGGMVTGVEITSSGNGYTSAPTVSFSGGGFTTPATATAALQSPGNIVLQGEANGTIAIQSVVITDNPIVAGQPATATVQLIFAAPLPDDYYTLTIDASSLVDPAGNELDGESNAAQPNGGPSFPSGNGIPGGNFVAAFTVNSRPEIGTWSGGSAWIDTNGNFTWDPNNTVAANRDVAYSIGYASDKDFAGDFSVPTSLNGPASTAISAAVNIVSATESGNTVTITTATPHGFSYGNTVVIAGVGVAGYNGSFTITSVPSATTFTYKDSSTGLAASSGGTAAVSANGFSKLSAYGLVNGSYRWLIENDGGVPIINYTDPNQINGQPIAGDWNPTGTAPAGHDEVGLYDGTNWDLFTGGLYGDGLGGTLTKVPIWHAGYPIVGDFDGDGHIDLATYDISSETFYFQLWDPATKTWDIHQTINVSGDGIQLGANTRPVAADLDHDGITDIGLYTPNTTGGTSNSPSDWYFLMSNDFATNTQGQPIPQKRITGQVNTLNHPYSPVSLGGHDLYAEMGNTYAVPIIGLFDPLAGGSVTDATVLSSNWTVLSGDISADLTGPGGLTKDSAGTVVLSGSNSYSGGTTVLAGTLTVSSAGSLPDGSSLTIGAGGGSAFGGAATATVSTDTASATVVQPSLPAAAGETPAPPAAQSLQHVANLSYGPPVKELAAVAARAAAHDAVLQAVAPQPSVAAQEAAAAWIWDGSWSYGPSDRKQDSITSATDTVLATM